MLRCNNIYQQAYGFIIFKKKKGTMYCLSVLISKTHMKKRNVQLLRQMVIQQTIYMYKDWFRCMYFRLWITFSNSNWSLYLHWKTMKSFFFPLSHMSIERDHLMFLFLSWPRSVIHANCVTDRLRKKNEWSIVLSFITAQIVLFPLYWG